MQRVVDLQIDGIGHHSRKPTRRFIGHSRPPRSVAHSASPFCGRAFFFCGGRLKVVEVQRLNGCSKFATNQWVTMTCLILATRAADNNIGDAIFA